MEPHPSGVILLQMDPRFTRVSSGKILEQSTTGLNDPTHGVVVGDTFYYIANSGWASLDEHGEVKPGLKLTPARIVKYQLN